jgi:hypothetical protein
MRVPEGVSGILDLLVEHEQAIGRLYRVYSEMFPEHQGFWLGLAAEEMMHAARIDGLPAASDGERPDPVRISPSAVSSSLEYVAKRVREAETRDLGLVTALSVALDLERAMIERKWFEGLDSDSPAAAGVLSELQADTRRHILMITALWESVRRHRA